MPVILAIIFRIWTQISNSVFIFESLLFGVWSLLFFWKVNEIYLIINGIEVTLLMWGFIINHYYRINKSENSIIRHHDICRLVVKDFVFSIWPKTYVFYAPMCLKKTETYRHIGVSERMIAWVTINNLLVRATHNYRINKSENSIIRYHHICGLVVMNFVFSIRPKPYVIYVCLKKLKHIGT